MKKISILLCILIFMTTIASYGDMNGPYRDGFIEGFVKSRLDNIISIEEYDGTLHQIIVDQKATLLIDNVPVALTDFKSGMEVYGELKGRQLVYLDSFSTENPGYISPGSKLRSGTVKKIDRDQMILRTPFGQEESYFLSSGTIIQKKGKNIPASSLYEGDRVKLYFDEIHSTVIARMEIEGDSILIKDLYRGQLASVDALEDVLVLENVEKLNNEQWQAVGSTLRIPYNGDIPMYVGGQKISSKNLKYYKGRRIYMAVKDYFGKDKIEKLVIRSQYETLLSEKIKAIDWYADRFELANNKNLSLHDGTIIVKNGRLVDSQALYANSDALIVADGTGSNLSANVVKVYNEGLNNSNIGQSYLYAGRLNRIFEDRVYLKDFFLLEQNEWNSFRTYSEKDEKELFYSEDTDIYDLENNVRVTAKEFFAKDYAVEEDSDYVKTKGLKDWYGYMLTDGDQITSIVVQKPLDNLLAQRVTNGIIQTVREDSLVGWVMEVRDAQDWSSRNQKWMAKGVNVRINLEKAMIVKDGKSITPEDLKAGDRLYIVRDDFKGKVVVVK